MHTIQGYIRMSPTRCFDFFNTMSNAGRRIVTRFCRRGGFMAGQGKGSSKGDPGELVSGGLDVSGRSLQYDSAEWKPS